jgi:hypothetical protein
VVSFLLFFLLSTSLYFTFLYYTLRLSAVGNPAARSLCACAAPDIPFKPGFLPGNASDAGFPMTETELRNPYYLAYFPPKFSKNRGK